MLFSTSDELSLGLAVANSPLDVISRWVAPLQSNFNLTNDVNADWFISAAQLLVLHGDLSQHSNLISCLPIVCENEDGSTNIFEPSKKCIFAPLTLLSHLPDKAEFEIVSTLLKTKKKPILMASSEYFDSTDLNDLEIRDRWQKLFSIAGES